MESFEKASEHTKGGVLKELRGLTLQRQKIVQILNHQMAINKNTQVLSLVLCEQGG